MFIVKDIWKAVMSGMCKWPNRHSGLNRAGHKGKENWMTLVPGMY